MLRNRPKNCLKIALKLTQKYPKNAPKLTQNRPKIDPKLTQKCLEKPLKADVDNP